MLYYVYYSSYIRPPIYFLRKWGLQYMATRSHHMHNIMQMLVFYATSAP